MTSPAVIKPPPLPGPASLLRVRAEKFGLAGRPGAESGDAALVFEQDGVAVAALADGLGSAREGRAAAVAAVTSLRQAFSARPQSWTAGRVCEEILRHLNRRLWEEGLARFEAPELACTIVVAALEGDRLFLLNAGDSRGYLWRGGELRQLSTDHREADPARRHVLTRALGLAEEMPPAVADLAVCAGDVVLLCSDGVTDVLDDDALAGWLAGGAGASAIVAAAAQRASAETRDDATAVTVRVVEAGTARAGRGQGPRVPGVLKAGEVVDGFTLRRSFRSSDRVWLAVREGNSFVLKFPPAAAAKNDAALAVFLREVWHATQLRSEFFPAAFVPEDATTRFYAQEYLHAPTLKKFLADHGPLAPAQAVALGRFLLRAEQFLLGHGFAHGDLKPENIIMPREADGEGFRLIDLGNLAPVFSLAGRAGTPSYLAPERFTGAAITERTEVFAVGAVLYEALTGRLPYGEVEPFQKPVFSPPRAVTAQNAHVPPWLGAVVMRATVAQPERRQQTYSEMLFELENPAGVRPFFRPGTPLLERDPLRFYRTACWLLLLATLVLGGLLLRVTRP